MLYDHILEFRGEWRSYQKRVLDHFLEMCIRDRS